MNRLYSLCLLLLCQLTLWAQIGVTDDFNPSNPPNPDATSLSYRVYVETQPERLGTSLASGSRFQPGMECWIYAYENDNYKFQYWQQDGKTVSKEREYHFTMPEHDVKLVAVYKFDPQNPGNPNANHWDPGTGELIMDEFPAGDLSWSISRKVGSDNYDKITSLTVIGTVNSWDPGVVRSYSQCKLLDLSRTKGMDFVPSWLFEDCTALTDVILPSSIKSIEWYSFYGCTSLQSVTCFAEVPPYLDPTAFESVGDGVVIYVPVDALSLYQDAEIWKEFTILPIASQASSITVNLPEGTDVSLYKDMFLELINQNTGKKQRYVITGRTDYTFSSLPHNTVYTINLVNKKGDVLGTIPTVNLKEEDISVTFGKLEIPRELKLTVITPEGKDVTDQLSITWFDEKDNYLNSGATLSSMLKGDVVKYRIQLPEALATQYQQEEYDPWEVSDDNDITETLTAIPTTSVSGSVFDAATELPIFNATITISQTLNGQYTKSFSAKTNMQGLWSCENVFQAPTDITASATDYVSQTQKKVALNADIPAFRLKDINGTMIQLGYTFTTTAGETEDFYSDYTNVSYEITNKTLKKPVTDFNVQYPQIVLMESLPQGTELSIKAISKNNKFMPVTVTGTVDEVDRVKVTIPVKQLGGLTAKYGSTENAKVSGILYDADGHLVKSSEYAGGEITFSELPDGTYTLVTMGKSAFFNSIYDLSQFRGSGLKEKIDYVQNQATVISGAIITVENGQIPTLDETKLYYTNDNTAITVNKSQVTAGQYLTLNSRIGFKDVYANDVEDVKLIVDLPQECDFVDGSVMVGNSTASYTFADQRLTIPLINYSDKVRFCVVPTAGGTYSPGASIQFTIDGREITQPIGNVSYTVKDLSINVPSVTADTKVPVSGVAVGKADVEIYDNGMLAGKTSSLANGAWATTIDLGEPYNMSTHQIYAKIKTEKGQELASETKSVTYDKDAVQPSKVTMYYSNPEIYQNYELVFDFLNPKTSPMRYTYYIYNRSFTFTVDFTANDPERISNVVLYVKTGDGKWHPLETTWDEKQQKWVVSQEFGNMYDGIVPVNVDVSYTFISDSPVDNSAAFQTEMDAIAVLGDYSATLAEKLITAELEEDEETYSTFILKSEQVPGVSVRVKVEPLDYNEAYALTSKEQFSFAIDGDGFYCVQDALTDNVYVATIVDTNEQYALRLTMSDVDVPDVQAARTKAPAVKNSIIRNAINAFKSQDGTMFFNGLGMFSDMLGLKKYTDATGFKNWLGMLDDYVNSDLQWRQIALNAILAKCADGDYRLSKEKINELNNKLQDIEAAADGFHKMYLDYLESYQVALRNSAMYDIGINVATIGIGKLVDAGAHSLAYAGRILTNSKNANYFQYILPTKNKLTRERVANILAFRGNQIISGLIDVIEPEVNNFEKISEEMGEWAPKQNAMLSQAYQKLINEAKANYGSCKPEPNPTDDTPHNTVNPDCDVPIDPSGYVYEAVSSNRVQGATATVYYKETLYDMYGDPYENIDKWDAAEYAQENPLFTDENGMYRWDVPQGLWQVKFEKEGYETTYSEWLPVPPPQLDVNIAMTQMIQPKVASAKAFDKGVEIEFDKYMIPGTLTAGTISVQKNGNKIEGNIVLLDEEKANENDETTYVSKIRFEVPEGQELTSTDQILLTVSKSVKSYAGVQMAENYKQEFDVLPIVREVGTEESLVNIEYGKSRTLKVAAKPGDAAKEKTVKVMSLSETIAKANVKTLTLDANGEASLTISGELPGSTALTFVVMENEEKESDVKGQVIVNVKEAANLLTLAPTASRMSGAEVYSGTKIQLASETSGAKIYYTVDGNSPKDNEDRLTYNPDEPIVIIDDNTVIKAMAQGEDLPESEVKEFKYTLKKTNLNYQMPAGWKWISHNLADPVDPASFLNVDRILSQTAEVIKDPVFGLIGNLNALLPTQAYKVKTSEANEKPLQGYEFNASANAVPLEIGWNWIGYPVSQPMMIGDALYYFAPSEGDMMVGQDGSATFVNGAWKGDLKMIPGQGYLYKSGKKTAIDYNTTITSNATGRVRKSKNQVNSPWAYDKYAYANIMPVTAQLFDNGVKVDDVEFIVGAFAGTECRGIGTWIEGNLMMNVYGNGGEDIHFVVFNTANERFYDLKENVTFTADNLGTWQSPYRMSMHDHATGIESQSSDFSVTPVVAKDFITVNAGGRHISRLTITNAGGQTVVAINELGRGGVITTASLPEGVYIVTIQAEGQNYYQKIFKTSK